MSIVKARTRVRVTQPKRIADSYDGRASKDRNSWRSYSSYSFMRDVHGTSPGSSSRATYKKKPTPTIVRESANDRRARLNQLATSKYANM